jgi:hypothetical protein
MFVLCTRNTLQWKTVYDLAAGWIEAGSIDPTKLIGLGALPLFRPVTSTSG